MFLIGIGHFLETALLVYYWLVLHILIDFLRLLLKFHALKTPVILFLAILRPNDAFFVPFSNHIILGRAALYESVFMSK